MILNNLALIVCILGGVLYLVLEDPKYSKFAALMKDCFWVGLLAFLLHGAYVFVK